MTSLAKPVTQLVSFHFRSIMRNKVALFFNVLMPLLMLALFRMLFGRNEGFFGYMLPALLTQMILTGGMVTMAIGVASYRQTGTLRHLFTTPMSISQWLVSLMGASLVLTALQFAILLATSHVLYDAPAPANFAGTIVTWFVATMTALGFGLVVGSVSPSPEVAMPVSLILYFGMAFLGGAMMPLEEVPQLVETLSRWMPSRWMVDALTNTMARGESFGTVLSNLVLLLALAAILVGVAAWRTRKQFLTA